MKTLLLPLLMLLCISGPSSGSPIQETLETPTQVKEGGIEMSCGEVDMDVIGAGKVRDFIVTWTVDPEFAKNAEQPPSRIFLAQFRDKKSAENFPSARLLVTFKMEPDGKCRADFRIAEEDLERTTLHFMLGSHMDYIVSLSDYAGGFQKGIAREKSMKGE